MEKLILMAGSFALVVILALNGVGRRGLYIAWAMAACVIGYAVTELSDLSNIGELRGQEALAALRGAEFFAAIAPWVLPLAVGIGVGSAIGAAVYRPRKKTTVMNTVACPFCAEQILPAAIVCKHCGRDVPPGNEPADITKARD